MKAIKIFYIFTYMFYTTLLSGCNGTDVSRKLKSDLLSDTNTITRINKILNEKGIYISNIYTTDNGSCYLTLEYDVLRYNQLKQDLKESSK